MKCPVCGDEAAVFYQLGRLDREAWRCAGCAFTWLVPPLRTEDSEYKAHYEDPAYMARFEVDEPKFRRHLADIDRAVDLATAPNRRLLEVGSSHGFLLGLLAARGFAVEGIELQQAGVAATRALGLPVQSVPLEEFSAAEPFGVVLSTHVVEHLRDIGFYFRKTAELLAPGGYSIILTPNGDALLFKLFRRFWTGATPDEHNVFLGFRAVRRLAESHGFEVLALKTTGRFWPVGRGLLAEGYRTVQARRRPAGSSGPAATVAGAERSWRNRIFRLLGWMEFPFLTVLHTCLSPFGLSDELLTVLRKKKP